MRITLFALILTAVSWLTARANPNLLANPGFETGDASGWTNSYGTYAVTGTNPHSGTYAAQISYGSAIQQTVTGLTPNTSYTLTGWLQVTTAGQNAFLMAQSFGGSAEMQWASMTNYTLLTLNFTTGATNDSAVIGVYQSGADPAWCDDLNLSVSSGVTNFVSNPGFETGNTSGWVGGYGTSFAVSNNSYSGAYAAEVQPNCALQQVVQGLSPNTSYSCSGWLKNATAGDTVYLIISGYNGTNAINAAANTINYTKKTLMFTTGSTNTSATIVVYQAGTNAAYCDNFSVH
jgi:hypothetical protein